MNDPVFRWLLFPRVESEPVKDNTGTVRTFIHHPERRLWLCGALMYRGTDGRKYYVAIPREPLGVDGDDAEVDIGYRYSENATRHWVTVNGEKVYETHDERDAKLFQAQLIVYLKTL